MSVLAVLAAVAVLVLFLIGRANHPTEPWHQTMVISIGVVMVGLVGWVFLVHIMTPTIRILTGQY